MSCKNRTRDSCKIISVHAKFFPECRCDRMPARIWKIWWQGKLNMNSAKSSNLDWLKGSEFFFKFKTSNDNSYIKPRKMYTTQSLIRQT
jgi:hypothetical protein